MMVKQQLNHSRFQTWLRHVNKASFNQLTLTFAGHHVFAVVHHVGRHSGRAYTTPVVAWPIADGFIMSLPYGADTDWCRNVLVVGQGAIDWHGRTYPVSRPEVIDAAIAQRLVPKWARWLFQVFPVRDFLKVVRLSNQEGTSSHDRQ